ncbi:MAG: (d)CMP kinase [Halopseudomonas yangmingensis]|uniref:Cytidylate kinase n=1 Tax=Halopseudomonas yangmingensis TaxID=1720063 RepID=A0A1I4S791_9GAMM|nr:(d)CMP kinase [Halopseudomonas yangmingensis]SFM60211.1 cytidylate kinase [Halopseudomonas yangmingensis]
MSVPVIALDGPGGSGKGTIAGLLAGRLGWHLLDSGALYRVLAQAAQRHAVALDDEAALAVLARELDVRFVVQPGDEQQVLLEGDDVTRIIRTETAGAGASQVAALPAVREALLQRQRDFCQSPGLVADGRDMGTVVFTGAPLKIYLTASAEERATRRYRQLLGKGEDANLASLLEEIIARDARDMNRSVAPLKPADDAIIVDSTQMSIEQVLETVEQAARERGLLG